MKTRGGNELILESWYCEGLWNDGGKRQTSPWKKEI
jgi:hypothetical protein